MHRNDDDTEIKPTTSKQQANPKNKNKKQKERRLGVHKARGVN
jgi:hypothetical protein